MQLGTSENIYSTGMQMFIIMGFLCMRTCVRFSLCMCVHLCVYLWMDACACMRACVCGEYMYV